jgi:saccharopine dehydrogenase-like NADP-dependent oxidoreductase
MHRVLLLGAGKIGRMIARMLHATGEYDVRVADADVRAVGRIADALGGEPYVLDATDGRQLVAAMQDRDVVVSALSFSLNPGVAEAALQAGCSYFDLTEDIATTQHVLRVAEEARNGQIFMPQCGLAPGFISIIANHLAAEFSVLDSVRMRVGALPQYPTDALKYNLTWSTDGLINEYCNPCDAIHEGRRIEVLPLEGLEHFSLDGDRYEAFNTSGGLGTLCETLDGKVRELNYKTIRYMGHRDLVSFLVNDLRLSQKRETLKTILEEAVPITFQDVVITFCTVKGMRNGQLVQLSDARKIYSQTLGGENWSAIQITTAAGLCAVVDMHFQGALPQQGFVRQEQVAFPDFIANRFGCHYQSDVKPRWGREADKADARAEESSDE